MKEAVESADRQAIERLRERDMRASREQDFQTLRSLITDDAVILPPGGAIQRGKETLDANFERMKLSAGEVEILDYRLIFDELKILGDYAFEWGRIEGAMRARGSDDVVNASYKVMRILQRQADGQWKVHRSIWNENPKEQAE